MYRYLPDLAARSAPRYTSYPTAVEFHDGVGAAEQREALKGLSAQEHVSLYVHIPYCHRICWYCGCNTSSAGQPGRLGAYVASLIREIETVGTLMRAKVSAIQFGGGSPNALDLEDFAAIMAAIRTRFEIAPDVEIAVELDPRTLNADYAALLGSLGVARVSLGVQTFAEPVQRRINRFQPYWSIVEAVRDLRYAGIRHINFDLMYGLPGQTQDDVAETITAALRLHPDRIAMFGYAHMPALIARQRAIDPATLPDAEARFAQSALAHDMFVAAGYRAIGFDHFALPEDSLAKAEAEGRLRRNFQGFTDDAGVAVIGLGASAISQFDGLIVQNEKNIGRYRRHVADGGLAGVRGVVRTEDARLRGAVIERLLCYGDVDVRAKALVMGLAPETLLGVWAGLQDYVDRGIITTRDWRVTVAPWARPYGRLIASSAFDAYRSAGTRQFSRAI
jgi:oxygen-independent coproporphyrinogen-3 oxidase